MVSKLKDFLQALYEYFPNSPKHHLEFTKCAKIVKIEQLKVFQLLKHVWEKYKMLITNMVIDYSSMESTKANLLNLIGIDTIIGFTWYIFPMLEFVNALMKFVHAKNVRVYDYIVVVQIYQENLYKMYGDSNTSF